VKPGDKVVIDGASRLSEGSKVAVVQPAAAAARQPSDNPPHRERDADRQVGPGDVGAYLLPPPPSPSPSPLPQGEGSESLR